MHLTLETKAVTYPRQTPFRIAKWVHTEEAVVVAVLRDSNGHEGLGEATGDYMTGETQKSVLGELEQVRSALADGASAESAYAMLKPGAHAMPLIPRRLIFARNRPASRSGPRWESASSHRRNRLIPSASMPRTQWLPLPPRQTIVC
jgi:hypothetical protein